MSVYQRRSRLGGDTEAAPKSIGPDYCEHNPIPRQLRRRRAASWRMQAFCPSCSARDPLCCRCYENREPTTRMTEAAIDAAEHLRLHGLSPLYSIAQGRALWRAGRRDLATLTSTQVVAA